MKEKEVLKDQIRLEEEETQLPTPVPEDIKTDSSPENYREDHGGNNGNS